MFQTRKPRNETNQTPTPTPAKSHQNDGVAFSSETEPTPDGTEETPPTGTKKPRAKRGTGLNAQRQTESLRKIRSTLVMVFGGTAGTLRMMGNIAGNDALLADSFVFSPVNQVTGNVNQSVNDLIEAIVKLSEQDKNVRDMLLSLGSGSAYTNVVVAALPMIIAVLANHNLIPNIFKAAPAPEQVQVQAPVQEVNPNVQNG